jgi:hypothetical protein
MATPLPANPFCALDPVTGAQTAAAPRLSDPEDAAADNFVRGFDPQRFFEAIEPLPLFLQTPRDIADIFARAR